MSRKEKFETKIREMMAKVPVTDIHTHLFPPQFGKWMLSGVDELLQYHYLIAETLRLSPISYQSFWKMSRRERASFIWNTLFVTHTPLSEAALGVLTTLQKLGISSEERDLDSVRRKLPDPRQPAYVDRVFQLAGVESVVMTNDPFDEEERRKWLEGAKLDDRFHAALRLDVLFSQTDFAFQKLLQFAGMQSGPRDGDVTARLRDFVTEWVERTEALYVAISFPPDFRYPDQSARTELLEEVVLPVCREKNIPLALMIGARRGVNPQLYSAGDSVGKADIQSLETLCRKHPKQKFLVTMLSRENQYELTVTARKFPNLMIFGCWWFLNHPASIQEITTMRLELLGPGFIPQHSDARILEQLIYKWEHSRKAIAEVLARKYVRLEEAGRQITDADIHRDVKHFFHDVFWNFLKKPLPATADENGGMNR